MIVKKSGKRKNAFQYDHETVFRMAAQSAKTVYELLETGLGGLSDGEVETRTEQYGENEITREQHDSG